MRGGVLRWPFALRPYLSAGLGSEGWRLSARGAGVVQSCRGWRTSACVMVGHMAGTSARGYKAGECEDCSTAQNCQATGPEQRVAGRHPGGASYRHGSTVQREEQRAAAGESEDRSTAQNCGWFYRQKAWQSHKLVVHRRFFHTGCSVWLVGMVELSSFGSALGQKKQQRRAARSQQGSAAAHTPEVPREPGRWAMRLDGWALDGQGVLNACRRKTGQAWR